MQKVTTDALRRAVIRRALSDAAFRDELRENAAAAIETRFGAQPYRVRVVFEAPDELSLLLPDRTEELAQATRATAQLASRTPTKQESAAILMDRAWTDPVFLAGLRQTPSATFDAFLKEHGARLPPGLTVRFYEEAPGECLVVITKNVDKQVSAAELQRWNDVTAEYDRRRAAAKRTAECS